MPASSEQLSHPGTARDAATKAGAFHTGSASETVCKALGEGGDLEAKRLERVLETGITLRSFGCEVNLGVSSMKQRSPFEESASKRNATKDVRNR